MQSRDGTKPNSLLSCVFCEGKSYDETVDVFSFGIVLCEVSPSTETRPEAVDLAARPPQSERGLLLLRCVVPQSQQEQRTVSVITGLWTRLSLTVFKSIVHSNRNQLSIYCMQSPGLAAEGFRHESDPVPPF